MFEDMSCDKYKKKTYRQLIISGTVKDVTKILQSLRERYDTVDEVIKAYGNEVVIFN